MRAAFVCQLKVFLFLRVSAINMTETMEQCTGSLAKTSRNNFKKDEWMLCFGVFIFVFFLSFFFLSISFWYAHTVNLNLTLAHK